jgi:poly-gamma-glutamate synthesis protein (capsule biosynthesis protein)
MAGRLVAATVLLAVVLVLAYGLVDGGSGERARPPPGVEEVVSSGRERRPVRLTISVSGDMLIHSPVWESALALGGGGGYEFGPLLEQVRPYVRGAEIAVCHVETPIAPGPPHGYPLFNTPPELAGAIAQTGWDACSTASNHSVDQGQEGIDATLDALDRAGVEHTGTYASERAARKPLILRAKGVRIAYLAYATSTNGVTPPAPWSLDLAATPTPILRDARRASRRADAVIVNVHWGPNVIPEYVTEPSEPQVEFVRRLASSRDITAIVGQGPHVVQRIDRVEGKPVVFSEGNLISAQGADAGLATESQEGLIGLLDLGFDGSRARVQRVRYVPTWVQHPGYRVLPVGSALRTGSGDPAILRAAYERVVGIAGRARTVEPLPPKFP